MASRLSVSSDDTLHEVPLDGDRTPLQKVLGGLDDAGRTADVDAESAKVWVPKQHANRTLVLCFDGTGDQFDSDVRPPPLYLSSICTHYVHRTRTSSSWSRCFAKMTRPNSSCTTSPASGRTPAQSSPSSRASVRRSTTCSLRTSPHISSVRPCLSFSSSLLAKRRLFVYM